MDELDIRPILESLLFVSATPLRLEALVEILPEFDREAILNGIRQIQTDWDEASKGLELIEVAGGYQLRTKPRWAEWVSRLKKVKAVKLSQSALETLAIIAYRQPVIRPEIEQIRGVDSGWVVRTLMEKGLVKMMGRKDLPGRPMIYGTTKAFLELFGLNAVSDLPTLKEVAPPTAEGVEEEVPGGQDEKIPPPQTLPPVEDSLVETEIEEVLGEIESSEDEDVP
jgi:segregation and condensation protein B